MEKNVLGAPTLAALLLGAARRLMVSARLDLAERCKQLGRRDLSNLIGRLPIRGKMLSSSLCAFCMVTARICNSVRAGMWGMSSGELGHTPTKYPRLCYPRQPTAQDPTAPYFTGNIGFLRTGLDLA
jgi:hypothetical protein